jgi:hypothetical protein
MEQNQGQNGQIQEDDGRDHDPRLHGQPVEFVGDQQPEDRDSDWKRGPDVMEEEAGEGDLQDPVAREIEDREAVTIPRQAAEATRKHPMHAVPSAPPMIVPRQGGGDALEEGVGGDQDQHGAQQFQGAVEALDPKAAFIKVLERMVHGTDVSTGLPREEEAPSSGSTPETGRGDIQRDLPLPDRN